MAVKTFIILPFSCWFRGLHPEGQKKLYNLTTRTNLSHSDKQYIHMSMFCPFCWYYFGQDWFFPHYNSKLCSSFSKLFYFTFVTGDSDDCWLFYVTLVIPLIYHLPAPLMDSES